MNDAADIVTFLTAVLKHNFATGIQDKDGDQAPDLVQKEKRDRISLDISMAEKSGNNFYREMKAADRWKKIPIIIVTGVSEDIRKFLSSRHQVPPPEGYLAKPVNREEILTLIQKLTAIP